MIQLHKKGTYRLLETKTGNKVLQLDNSQYVWIRVKHIGEILVFSEGKLIFEDTLSVGEYRLFDVENEPDLVDLQHLELAVGPNDRQGYILLTGLPTKQKRRSRIIPTDELVD